MKVVSWNVNSIRARLESFRVLAERYSPDVVLLQETRVEDHAFPSEFIEDLGYNLAIKGQKARNGVAICSKFPLEEVNSDFSEDARYIEAFTGGIFVASVYVPNGQEVDCPQYFYKLEFLKCFVEYLKKFHQEIFVLGGDFNVGPYPHDIYIKNYDGIAGTQRERDAIACLRNSGFKDILEKSGYTWWSYRQRGFKKDNGFRLDQFYLNHETQKIFKEGCVLLDIRKLNRPSDHAPIMCEIDR
ncbi:MAG: exodeoxyribonuclease III [Alphaproteobacteria bacterium]|nr:exodeoxyribonuclease III [Alphaproteobacteria bacterium]